jgi:hypothetical protein
MREKRRKQKHDKGEPSESEDEDECIKDSEEILLNLRQILSKEDQERAAL